jgi:uncharacterized protein (TIGR03084 family)
MEIFDDLEAEEERLESILSRLDEEEWCAPSGAAGWTIADVVLHLGQSEELVVASDSVQPSSVEQSWSGPTVEESVDRLVREQRAEPQVVFERWKAARRGALETLRNADPRRALRWAVTPLKPKTLATTRLAEHWAHGLDITGPLAIAFDDTDRLRHVAWLAHNSLPYSFSLIGEPSHDIYCELGAPTGDTWRYGSPEADSTIEGPAGAFCRVGARRLEPTRSGLVVSGPYGSTALQALRNYAA